MKFNQNVSPRANVSALDLRQSMNNRGRMANENNLGKYNNMTGNIDLPTLPQLNERFTLSGDEQKQDQGRSMNKPKSAVPQKRRIKQQLSPPSYQGMTIQQQQRINNIGISENAVNLSFETRIKEIYNARESSTKLNPKVIETWINETLLDAEHLDIPGNSGIPNEYVDRIYRGLFVYSIGFYEMLQRCLHHSENKYTLLSSLWKVFAILLEYCCKSNYQMLISKISKEHKEELDKMEVQFTEHIHRLTENEKNLKESLENLQQKKDELEKQKEEETFLRKKIEEEFTKNVQNHEEEVQLRLKFESKLNNMHALHRDLQAKYQRALEDIYQLENQNHTFSKLVSEQKAELIELRSERVENESKIVYQGERIKQLIQENELKLRQINDLEVKQSKANSEIEQKTLSLKTAEKQVNEMRLKIDANRSLIDSLTSEKNHLELSLKENKDQKEQFKEKCDRLQKLHEDVFQEMQEYKKQLVGIQEIKKDRDDRIEKLRDEFEELSAKYDVLDREHTSLKVHHVHISEEHEQLKMDYESVSEKLKISNKVRNEKEEQLNEKINQTNSLLETIKDRDYQIDKQRKELDKLSKRLSDVERQNDSLEIKKKSLDKQSEIQRKQLLDKIQNLNELVSAEKDTREMWINRYEKEQKAHIATNTDLLTTKGQLQDAQLKLKNLEIIIESLSKSRDQTKDSNDDLQNNLTKIMAKNETLERDLYTKSELLRTVEDQHRIYLKKIREDFKNLNEKNQLSLYIKDIEYEDLRSYTRKLFEQNDQRQIKIEQLSDALQKMTESKDQFEKDLSKLQEQYDEISRKYSSSQESLRKEIEKASELDYQVQQYSRQIDNMHEEIECLEKQIGDLKQLESQNQIMNEKIKILEASLDMGVAEGEIVKKSKANLVNRGIQTKKIKQKERNIQTDFQGAFAFPQQVLFSTTQASTSVGSQKRPRIASAANTTTTMGMSGANLMRDPSQGLTSTIVNSQGELYFQEGVNLGSGSNILDYERVIKSAAQKYRHMIPGEAIQEEAAENVTRVGMFKRNSNIQEEDEHQDEIRRTGTGVQNDYIYESNGAQSKQGLYIRQDSSQQRGIGYSMPTTALQKHQQASRQRLRGLNNYMETGQDVIKRQPSTHSSKRSGEIKDDLGQEVLKSVYEKRVNAGGISKQGGYGALQYSRPITQPGQNRTVQLINHGLTGGTAQDNIEPIFTPSDSSQMNKFKFENQQYQQTLQSHTTINKKQSSSKSNDRFVKGRPSIKTLIKVATARDS